MLSCSNLGFTKSLFLDMPLLHNQAFNHPTRDQESQSQGKAFKPAESVSQESDDTSGTGAFLFFFFTGAFLEMPAAHNRTARNVNHPCVSRIIRAWDSCRKNYVDKVQCLSTHVFCLPVKVPPKCKTVYGYPQAQFISKCAMLPIGCQCAV